MGKKLCLHAAIAGRFFVTHSIMCHLPYEATEDCGIDAIFLLIFTFTFQTSAAKMSKNFIFLPNMFSMAKRKARIKRQLSNDSETGEWFKFHARTTVHTYCHEYLFVMRVWYLFFYCYCCACVHALCVCMAPWPSAVVPCAPTQRRWFIFKFNAD